MKTSDRGAAKGRARTENMWPLRVAVLGMMAVLSLIPVCTLAQMGSREEWDRGIREWMGPRSDPKEQKPDAVPRQATPPPSVKPSREDARQPSMSGPMPLPAVPVPFYRERTFLVLVGVAAAAGAFVGYRLTWLRWRRRRGPANSVIEAVLVVDLVGSTHLATHYGDGLAMKARTSLRDRTLAQAETHGFAFAENTGDGYFMTFPSVTGAVRTAVELLKNLKDQPPDLSPGPPLQVRAGISYGEILVDARGTRHGAVINRAFRLEGLNREAFTQVEGAIAPEEIPDRNRIFLDEEAAHEARPSNPHMRFVGFASLKGFSGLHRVYELLWDAHS